MNFFNDLKAEFNCAFNISTDFKVVMLNSVAYFENIVGVKSYSKENIELAIKKGNIIIKGQDLVIKKYSLGDLVICGTIKSLERN